MLPPARAVDNPAVVCLDLAAAFSSVRHSWLLRSLRAHGLPPSFCSVAGGLYQGGVAYHRVGGGALDVAYPLCSGVLQGCPLSGTLYNVVSDPFSEDPF